MSEATSDSPDSQNPRLTTARRRRLLARAHTLKARMTMGQAGLSQAFLDQARETLSKTDLLKVRLDAADRKDADRLAIELAQKVGCHLLRRVGYVAILYQPPEDMPDDN